MYQPTQHNPEVWIHGGDSVVIARKTSDNSVEFDSYKDDDEIRDLRRIAEFGAVEPAKDIINACESVL
jgi:hypothetical protein